MINKDDLENDTETAGGEHKTVPSSQDAPPNRHSVWGECRYRLVGLLTKHGHMSHDGAKRISYETSRSRSYVLLQGFEYLHSVQMCPRKPENFKPKHMQCLVRHWEEQGLSASTLQLRFSIFSTFCTWIGKTSMLGDIVHFLEDPTAARRRYVAQEDKSWIAKGVDPQAKIEAVAAVDPRVAIVLKVMHAFGLRIREAVTLHPKEADLVACLDVARGTKGKRPRVMQIVNDYQRQVLDEAKRFANSSTGSLIPDTFKRNTWIRYIYKILEDVEVSRKHGIVLHGFRHQRANDMYESLTGVKSPVRGGEKPPEEDKHARRVIAEELGHSRPQITGMYCGRKPSKKQPPEKK